MKERLCLYPARPEAGRAAAPRLADSTAPPRAAPAAPAAHAAGGPAPTPCTETRHLPARAWSSSRARTKPGASARNAGQA